MGECPALRLCLRLRLRSQKSENLIVMSANSSFTIYFHSHQLLYTSHNEPNYYVQATFRLQFSLTQESGLRRHTVTQRSKNPRWLTITRQGPTAGGCERFGALLNSSRMPLSEQTSRACAKY